ncbi:3' phosphoadenylyl thiosulfotransferase [Trichodelitschia bisporula]|uniref:phosphoadenylyl-sulfate reductase (thioredoxin) n=1 Tax=Trichodelitschia bisporula TaxID=703511 RepID=A0A6G1HN57_9PEZI|nr:3' phosphoadenylyl thiosulfotransferase [Trichodelitschia bisporula]
MVSPIDITPPATSHGDSDSTCESGYASATSDNGGFAEIYFTRPHLKYLNKQLSQLEPQDILKWCLISLPGLFQTTAFGLTGLVTIDMLSKIAIDNKSLPPLIFLDTLHHFPETLALVDRVTAKYPQPLHVYKPAGCETAADFTAQHGERFWDVDDERYDWVAKVEPAERAYAELGVKAVLTGRRRSQGGKRGDLDVLEITEAGLIKVNPLANWTFAQVQAYVREHDVPYNELLDRGYKSIGDWHSTQPIREGEDERAGRWRGKDKTECGIHNKRSRYAQFLMEQERLREREELQGRGERVEVKA